MEKTCATTVAIDVKHENGNVWTGKILKGTIRLKGPLATPELIASIAENPKREVNDFYKMTYVGQRFSDDVSDRVYYKGNMCLAVTRQLILLRNIHTIQRQIHLKRAQQHLRQPYSARSRKP